MSLTVLGCKWNLFLSEFCESVLLSCRHRQLPERMSPLCYCELSPISFNFKLYDKAEKYLRFFFSRDYLYEGETWLPLDSQMDKNNSAVRENISNKEAYLSL